MKLYKVTTTFQGADGASNFYFSTQEKAEKYLADQKNGEIEEVEFEPENPDGFFEGCVYIDMTFGW